MCKVRGVGLDVCGIARMEPLLADDRFLARYFTPAEQAYIRGKGQAAASAMAGIYAAKEAFLKALGIGIALPLRDIGVTHTALGQPVYALTGQAAAAAPDAAFLLSISHDAGVAAAVCIWEE